MYFGMTVTASYMEVAATVARGPGDLEVLVNSF